MLFKHTELSFGSFVLKFRGGLYTDGHRRGNAQFFTVPVLIGSHGNHHTLFGAHLNNIVTGIRRHDTPIPYGSCSWNVLGLLHLHVQVVHWLCIREALGSLKNKVGRSLTHVLDIIWVWRLKRKKHWQNGIMFSYGYRSKPMNFTK